MNEYFNVINSAIFSDVDVCVCVCVCVCVRVCVCVVVALLLPVKVFTTELHPYLLGFDF
jgi:hypothetical protein